MKLLALLPAACLIAIAAPAASAQNDAADKTDKKTVYVINGKRAEVFDPKVADMSAFKEIVKESQTAKLAAEAGITEQEAAECDVVYLKSKKPMYIAAKGQGVDYTGTVRCEDYNISNVYIMTEIGRSDADGKFGCRAKYNTVGYVTAKGCKGKRIRFTADMRKKITLDPTDAKTEKSDEKKPRYSIVNGAYVRTFDIDNYEPDEIISAEQVWERTDEVCNALTKAHIDPKHVEKHGALMVTLREDVQLAKAGSSSGYTLDIRDSEGNPISGARIFKERTHTDLHGCFALTAECGTKAIAIYKNNMLKVMRFRLGSVPTMRLELERNPQYDDDKPQMMVDMIPKYMGGNLTTFRNWVMNNITYPQKMQHLGKSGRVLVGFTVNKEGLIEDIEIIQSPHDDFSEEVVRVLKRSKKWTPGHDAGRAVSVRFVIPVDFRTANQ